jgi:hypothetical protein
MQEGVKIPGFAGAFHHGSTNWLAAGAELAPSSDVDVMIVLTDADLPPKLGKFEYAGVLLEVSFLSADRLCSAEAVLGDYHLAGSFWKPNVIADPTGDLRPLQDGVSRRFAQRQWVRARCDSAEANARRFIRSLSESEPFHDQVAAWLFATGAMTHVLLTAGLKNPTVRRRYVAVHELLAEYGMLEAYEPLLEALGCAGMSAARAEHHVAALAAVFDAAGAVLRTPFFFASDLQPVSRPIAIDGSRALIAAGQHREAMFWIVATFCRCLKVLHHDAPPGVQERFAAGFAELTGDLGVPSFAALRERTRDVERSLPVVSELANAIIAANPEIKE